MNDIIVAIILGIVEGVTEFLPISSTGHLILVGHWLNFTGDKANTFKIFIQLGAILAVMGYWGSRIWNLARSALQSNDPAVKADELQAQQARRFVMAILLAFFPAGLIGFFAYEVIEALLFTPKTVAAALVVGGVAIILIEKMRPQPTTSTMENLSWGQAIVVGLAQCFSLIPGMSRSAATIMGGLLARLDHAAAAEFSFFLAIPTIGAATIYRLLKSWSMLSKDDLVVFSVGLLVSLVVAWLVIAGFMAFIKRHSFVVFGWYRIVFGLGLLVALAMGWL